MASCCEHVGYQGTEIGNEGEDGQHGGFIGQEIVTADKLELNRKAACFEIARAQRELDAQRYRVLTSTRIGFYEVLIAQRSVELAEQLLTVGEEGVEAAESLIEAMQASRVDLLQARIEANNARVSLQNAQNRHSAAWKQLRAVVGSLPVEPAALVGSPEPELHPLEFQAELARITAASPEIGAAHAEINRARWALQRAQVEPIPNIDTQVAVQHDTGTEDTITSVQVGIALPIHDRNQRNIRIAHADVMAAHREVERIHLSLENRLAAAFERYSNATYQVERFTEDILPDARETLDLVTLGYREGEFDYLRILTAQRTYFQTNLQYLDALRAYWAARMEIEGLLLLDGLESQIDSAGGEAQR